ncbi:MAG: DUF4276 family protein [Dermatophilaceae bacterium]
MNHLEILVEGPSEEKLLAVVVPKIVPGVALRIHTFSGKDDLLKKLPNRLAGYSNAMKHYEMKVVIVVDRDSDDCRELKEKLESMAARAGLRTATAASAGQPFQVLNRIAIEELEAWLLGDTSALRAVYPKLPASLGQRSGLRDPDAVKGGTAEALARELKRCGYQTAGLLKATNAEAVAPHMDVEGNRSRSFQVFRDGLRRLMNEGVA